MLEKLRSKAREKLKPYIALESEPKEGAPSRKVKQSSSSVPVPEVLGVKGRVLRFLSEHQDELISYDDIARGSRTAKSRVGKHIAALVDEGIVAKSVPRPRHGTRYWVNGGPNANKPGPEMDERSSVEVPSSNSEEDVDFVEITKELVFSFIRATRSTDILVYLTWLENQGKNNE